MDVVVNEELKAYIDPLTSEEYEALERSLLAEGCRDALVLWGDVLVDGHNRYSICKKHGLPFQTVQNTRFQSMEDVHLWMIDQHLGRRSISDFQRGVLALRKREIIAARRAQRMAETAAPAESGAPPEAAPAAADPAPADDALNTRESLARAARLRSTQVAMIEKIHQSAAPEVVAAVKSGELSLNAAAAVASLPAEEQAAAAAGGKDELKQAAKRVREARRKPPREKDVDAGAQAAEAQSDPSPASAADSEELVTLRKRVAELKAENTKLNAEIAVLRKQVLNLLDKPAADAPPAPADAEADAPF
ncbi:plasmid replication/partition related protein [Variovorax soli]|uniref:plasmid replication/partition related protein n=1 Tax=Variovorax soli TaxID=376815 RepID=UPI00083966FB|nr:plasmid replication/partition related protein [Variovorax soli]